MPKVQKIVIRNIILIVLFSVYFKGYTQNEKDDYILLHKVVNKNLKHIDSIFELQEMGVFSFKKIKEYYRFKYNNEKVITIYDYDKEKDSIIKQSDEKLELFNKGYFMKFAILDSIFTQKEYNYIFKQKRKIIKWKREKLNKNIRFIERLSTDFGNYISKPLYFNDNKYAIIWCKLSLNPDKYMVFKKEKDQWKFVGEILISF